MNILSVNLASHKGHIAVCSESAVLASSEADHRMADNEIVPLIEKTLKDAKLAYHDLTHIACVIGPGGFTSIRSGVTIANVMSHELKIPLAGIHLSDLYFARVASPPSRNGTSPSPSSQNENSKITAAHDPQRVGRGGQGERRFWLHSTKKEQLFITGGSIAEPTLMNVVDALALLKSGDTWMGELIESQEEAVKAQGLTQAKLAPLPDVLPTFLAKQTYGSTLLEPWYGRGW